MNPRTFFACLAAVGALLCLTVDAGAQPKPYGNPKPNKGKEIYVVMKARLYEVDEASYNKLAKAKWRSRAELEELETRPQGDNALFALLAKQEPFLAGQEVNIDPGKEGTLLTATGTILCLPTPDQLLQGKKDPQIIHESLTFSAQVHISADGRCVRAKLQEKCLEIEGIEKVKVVAERKGAEVLEALVPPRLMRVLRPLGVDLKYTEAVGAFVFVKQASCSEARYIPDGGSRMLPLHYRPLAVRNKDRWLIAEITPRIYIEEEERARRGQPPK
jgi:hypothetical protein